MKQETKIQNTIMLELGKLGHRVFRSQVGLFYTLDGRRIHIGQKGQSDLHGHRVQDGKAFYIETKTPVGKASKEQLDFIKAMKESNSLAGFANSVEQALKILEGK